MADNEAAVPKFGEWNDRDATTQANYTAIFNQVREERQGVGGAPTLPRNINSTRNPDGEHNEKKCCCFPWPRK